MPAGADALMAEPLMPELLVKLLSTTPSQDLWALMAPPLHCSSWKALPGEE
jgi:hypothetical protein